MKALSLISEARQRYIASPKELEAVKGLRLFTAGARWMHNYKADKSVVPFNPALAYERYGWLKYGLSGLFSTLSLVHLWSLHMGLAPLAVLVFYACEVHLVFLFPLLLDSARHPIRQSLGLTYKVGLAKALGTVMLIGAYMLLGFFRKSSPFKNWHVGCIAVLLWYEELILGLADKSNKKSEAVF